MINSTYVRINELRKFKLYSKALTRIDVARCIIERKATARLSSYKYSERLFCREIFGLTNDDQLTFDSESLRKTFLTLTRTVHPDYFGGCADVKMYPKIFSDALCYVSAAYTYLRGKITSCFYYFLSHRPKHLIN
jgi:hypothetical protein